MNIRRRRRSGHAFTLLEIMLVVAILVLLLATGFSYFGKTIGIGQDARLQADFASFDTRLKTYEMLNGFLPTTEQGLQALVTQPTTDPVPTKWYQQMEKLPKDPWGSDYIYEQPGKHNTDSFDIVSPGKDRIPNTADDRGNWEFK